MTDFFRARRRDSSGQRARAGRRRLSLRIALCLSILLHTVAVGLPLPSGVAALTSFVRPTDWGKAVAVHELAPSGALMSGSMIFW